MLDALLGLVGVRGFFFFFGGLFFPRKGQGGRGRGVFSVMVFD